MEGREKINFITCLCQACWGNAAFRTFGRVFCLAIYCGLSKCRCGQEGSRWGTAALWALGSAQSRLEKAPEKAMLGAQAHQPVRHGLQGWPNIELGSPGKVALQAESIFPGLLCVCVMVRSSKSPSTFKKEYK